MGTQELYPLPKIGFLFQSRYFHPFFQFGKNKKNNLENVLHHESTMFTG